MNYFASMSNNLYYKILAALGTGGIVLLSATQVWTSLKVNNNTEDQLSVKLIDGTIDIKVTKIN